MALDRVAVRNSVKEYLTIQYGFNFESMPPHKVFALTPIYTSAIAPSGTATSAIPYDKLWTVDQSQGNNGDVTIINGYAENINNEPTLALILDGLTSAIINMIQTSATLDDLSDVAIVNPTSGDIIFYDSSDRMWKNTSQVQTSGSSNIIIITSQFSATDPITYDPNTGVIGINLSAISHSLLSNLNSDDHTQYFNQLRGDARYSQLSHNHDASYYTKSQTDTFLTAKVNTTRRINTALPLAGGNSLSADINLNVGGLSTIGAANQLVSVNQAGNAWEYRNIVGGTGVNIIFTDNQVTINTSGTTPVSAHNLLESSVHPDTITASVQRGALIAGQEATPKWKLLALGTANQFLKSDGTDVKWSDHGLVTSAIPEVTNLYYTADRAKSLFTATSGISYTSATAVFSLLIDTTSLGINGNNQLYVKNSGHNHGTGTQYYIPRFASTSTFQDSILQTDSANTMVGVGITPVFGLHLHDKSLGFTHPNVAHGMTDILPTNTFGSMNWNNSSYGGLNLHGLTDADNPALNLYAIIGNATTNTNPAFTLNVGKKNGTGWQAVAVTEKAFLLNNYTSTIVSILGNGDTIIGGSTSRGGRIDAYGRNYIFGDIPVTMGYAGSGYPSVGYNFLATASGGVYNYLGSDTAYMIWFGNTGMSFHYAAAGTAGNQITWNTGLIINPSGNIGFGVTDVEAWHSGYRAFESTGTSLMFSKTAYDMYLIGNLYFDGAWKYKNVGPGTVYGMNAGVHYFYTVTSGSTDQVASLVQSVTIDASAELNLHQLTHSENSNHDKILVLELSSTKVRYRTSAELRGDIGASPALSLTQYRIPRAATTTTLGDSNLYTDTSSTMLGLGVAPTQATLHINSYTGLWTTSLWGKGIYIGSNATAIIWYPGADNLWAGFGHTDSGWCWITSTALDNSAAQVQPMNLTNAGALTALSTITGTRLISNIAVGTAPLDVTSTTLVSNLNSDYLDGQHGSYYAPIGSMTGTQYYVPYWNATNTFANSPIYTNGTNVSIGTAGFSGKLRVDYSISDATDFNTVWNFTKTATTNGTYYNIGLFNSVTTLIGNGVTDSGYIVGDRTTVLRQNSGDHGTLAYLYGQEIYYGHITGLSGNATTTTAIGLAITPYFQTGTIGTSYALIISDPATGATVSTSYGLYVGAYHNNYMGGTLGIGLSTPESNSSFGVYRASAHNNLVVKTSNGAYDNSILHTDGTNFIQYGMLRASTGLTGAFSVFTSSANRFTINNAGNIGFNTLDIEAWDSGYGGIEFYADALMYNKSGDGLYINNNIYYDGNWKYKKDGAACFLSFNDGGFYFYTAPSGTENNVATYTLRVTIDNAGEFNLNTIVHETTDTDVFLVRASTAVRYRTGAEVLSDIGGTPIGSITGTQYYMPYWNTTTTFANSPLYVSGNNMGFNTADVELWNTTYRAIELGASSALMTYPGGDAIYWCNNVYFNTSGQWIKKANGVSNLFYMTQGYFIFLQNRVNGSAEDIITTWHPTFNITPDGLVGFNYDSPIVRLHVKETGSAAYAGLILHNTVADSYPFIQLQNDAVNWQIYNYGPNLNEFLIYDATGSGSRVKIFPNSGNFEMYSNGFVYYSIGANPIVNIFSPGGSYAQIKMDTVDGSDNKGLFVCGGGDTGRGRGAHINLYGNDYVGAQGLMFLIPGSNANIVYIGEGTDGVDWQLGFYGGTNIGIITWMEDEDYFNFNDGIFIPTGEQVFFGNTSNYIDYNTNGYVRVTGTNGLNVVGQQVYVNCDDSSYFITSRLNNTAKDAATLYYTAGVSKWLTGMAITADGGLDSQDYYSIAYHNGSAWVNALMINQSGSVIIGNTGFDSGLATNLDLWVEGQTILVDTLMVKAGSSKIANFTYKNLIAGDGNLTIYKAGTSSDRTATLYFATGDASGSTPYYRSYIQTVYSGSSTPTTSMDFYTNDVKALSIDNSNNLWMRTTGGKFIIGGGSGVADTDDNMRLSYASGIGYIKSGTTSISINLDSSLSTIIFSAQKIRIPIYDSSGSGGGDPSSGVDGDTVYVKTGATSYYLKVYLNSAWRTIQSILI